MVSARKIQYLGTSPNPVLDFLLCALLVSDRSAVEKSRLSGPTSFREKRGTKKKTLQWFHKTLAGALTEVGLMTGEGLSKKEQRRVSRQHAAQAGEPSEFVEA
jgi:hypothetical protein